MRQLISLPSQLQLLDRLQHHIYLSSSVIFVSGEQGSGKSTILEQLANKLPSGVQEAFLQLSEPLLESQIRPQIIAQLFEDPLFDAQDSLFSSISLLQEKQKINVPRLIVFDNANYLSPQLLVELTELVAQKDRLGENEINVLLLADGENSQKMFASANQACACLQFKLDALSKNEASNLLHHVFRQADYQQQIKNQDALLKHLSVCAGIPQKIIALGEQIVAGKLINNEVSWLKMRLPAIALMLVLLVVAGGLASYLYPIFINQSQPLVAVKKEPSILKNIDLTVPLSGALITSEEKPLMVEELAGKWEEKPRTVVKENLLQVGLKDKLNAGVRIVKMTPQESVTQVNKLKKVPEKQKMQDIQKIEQVSAANTLIEKEKLVIDNNSESQLKKEQPLEKAQEIKIIPEEQNKPDVQETKQVLAVNTPIEKEKLVIENKSELQPEVALSAESKNSDKQPNSIFTTKSKLLSVPASHYTLQLTGMASEKSLQEFISEHGVAKGDLHIYQTLRNNKPWYVVIFGEYDSHQAAKKASKALPGSLANLDSWIKKYQLVHQDLQLNNE